MSSSSTSVFPGEATSTSNEDGEPMMAAVYSVYLITFMVIFVTVYKLANTIRWQWIPSSCLYILAGMVAYGAICIRYNEFNPSFDPSFFFLLLLPPVIFNSGLEVNIPLFFQNYLTIMTFANLGTFINTLVVGFIMYWVGTVNASPLIRMAEGLSFGSVVSATDPVTTIAVFDRFKVDPNLYTIIVGVSVLDDAISVILFKIFNSFLSGDGITGGGLVVAIILFFIKMFVSLAVGFVLGLVFAYMIHSPLLKDNKALLTSLSIFALYFIYAITDAFYLSGIISTMLAGIGFQYFHRYRNLQAEVFSFPTNTSAGESSTILGAFEREGESFNHVRSLINQWSFLFESLVFVYIGITVFYHPSRDNGDAAFVFWSFVACIIGRIAQIYPLSYLLNVYQIRHVSGDEGEAARHRENHVPVSVHDEESAHGGNSEGDQPQPNISPGSITIQKPPVELTAGYQHMMMLAGLRGPIAYATSQWFSDKYGNQNMIAFATTLIVIFTTGVFGALTMPALHWFDISYGEEESTGNDEDAVSLKAQEPEPVVCLPYYLQVADSATFKCIHVLEEKFHQWITIKKDQKSNKDSGGDGGGESSTAEEGRGSIALSTTEDVNTEEVQVVEGNVDQFNIEEVKHNNQEVDDDLVVEVSL